MADTKQQWYKDAKYGLFIHWGLYSILAGEWKDPKTGEVTKTDRIAEWIENNLNIDKEDYRKLKDEFHPDKFDADMFVKRAKEKEESRKKRTGARERKAKEDRKGD